MSALEENPNESIRAYAARALGSQSSIPAGFVSQFVGHLESSEEATRTMAIGALPRVQPNLPHDTAETVVRLLDSPNEETIMSAMDALRGMHASDLPPSAVMKVASLCRRTVNPTTMSKVGVFLRDRARALPTEALQELVGVFGDPVTWGIHDIAAMLRRQTDARGYHSTDRRALEHRAIGPESTSRENPQSVPRHVGRGILPPSGRD